jgi:5-methylthioadenosine/S-adenosylhomocysteine deaminase
MALVLTGRVVTMDPEADEDAFDDGAVYVANDAGAGGIVEAVGLAAGRPPTGYESAPRIRTGEVIYPGLIDLHNHLAYNFRSLWFPPRTEPYGTRDQWPRAATYGEEITRPAVALGTAAAKAVLKFAEAKAVVGGTTAIQGSPGLSRPYEGWMVRNIEHETFGTGKDVIYQSVINLDVEELRDKAKRMEEGSAFIYHLAEGTDRRLLDEFRDAETAGCLQERLIAIHGTALGGSEFERWAKEGHAGSIVWSPFSNLWLYRETTDVVAAREDGIRICLGADWGPSGSKNVLGELKVADLWNRTRLDRSFSDRELCQMVTTNPGAALATAWGDRIGRIGAGLPADLVVTMDRRADAYRNLIEATERHVRLVVVGGRAVYGSSSLMEASGATSPEPITVGGVRRSISMLDPGIPDADLSWSQVVEALERARRDPVRAFRLALETTPRGEEPLRLIPDMPGGELALEVRAPQDLGPVVIPPLDSLFHGAAFVRGLEPARAPILGGVLEGLRDYYSST